MGDYQNVPYDTELKYKVYQLQGKKAGQQASSGSFAFPTHTWREGTLSTKTITGGMAVNYREVASGNTDAIAVANEQVITDMMNQMFYDVITNMYTTIKNLAATGITGFSEAGGINKAVVDSVIKIIRRWGTVTLSGDYSVISQLQDFVGFETVAAGALQFSEAVMEEIRKTGLLSNYNGSPIVEIPNSYNLTKLNPTGGIGGAKPFFDTYLPEGLLFAMPKTSFSSPLQVGTKGGVTSMAGQDINLGLQVQRFDVEFGELSIAA